MKKSLFIVFCTIVYVRKALSMILLGNLSHYIESPHLIIENKIEKSVPDHPNIIIINIDDMGWMDASFMGALFYETPNIDALSKRGTVFTNGYASASNCAPSRACLMTGEWPQRHGIYTVGSSERGKSKDRKLIPVNNTVTIADSFLLLPQLLRENGYVTCHAGKWHLSDDPLTKGFDINIGGSHAGHPSSYYPPFKNVDLKGKEGERLTDVVTDKTIDFIKNTNGPFFINFATYAVHTPIQPVKSLVQKYKGKSPVLGQSNIDYATMIENMDLNVGRLIKTLQETHRLKNTFIVFMSDNGGLFAVSNQHPLRAGKGSYYEGGIRVPFFFVWEGKINVGRENKTPITNLDIFPTLLEVANIKKPKDLVLDGESLVNMLLKEKSLEPRPLFWHFPVYLEKNIPKNENRDSKFRTRPGSVVRYGDWKLHHYYEDDGWELYNLKDDEGEQYNLAKDQPDKTEELRKLLNGWLARTHAPIPTKLNPDYVEQKP